MARKKQAEEEPEESSGTAGACVLVVLAAVVVAVTFRLSATVAVLTLWLAGVLALWRSARRMSDSSATPPPRGAAPSADVFAGETGEIARVVPIAEGVGFILHPVRDETPPN